MQSEKTIIEINGVKMEIDLRQAKRVDTFKVGDNVKVLVKQYEGYKSFPGAIVGFDEYKNLPTLVVCYLETGYNAAVKFAYINAESKDIEICPMNDEDVFEKAYVIESIDREINKKEAEVLDLKGKKAYFLAHYNMCFGTETKGE